jgi:cation:H+ antiporter
VLAGFGLITLGSFMMLRGATDLVRAFGITETVIGVTLVAFGTSLPELVTVIISSATHRDDIGFGNIVGSNIINVLGILGLALIIAPISITRGETTLATWVAFILASLYIVYCLAVRKQLTRYDGVILFVGFLLFNYFNYFNGKK